MLTEKIIKFCSLGDVGALQRLRVAPHALRLGDYDRRTPLHLSVSNGHEAMVSMEDEMHTYRVIPRFMGYTYNLIVSRGYTYV